MIDIIDFQKEHQKAFKALNYGWLNKYFAVEPIDKLVLNNPMDEIIAKGGKIFCAKVNSDIVGIAALINRGTHFELSKMAVDKDFQGKGIGSELMKHILQWSIDNNINYLQLYSHSRLKPALNLYKKFGFKDSQATNHLYSRADIVMDINL